MQDIIYSKLSSTREQLDSYLAHIISTECPYNARVVEVGGGSTSWIKLPPQSHIIAIDISPEQISRCDYANEKIVADIMKCDFPPESYDLAVFWDVLEHLEHPLTAVERCFSALKPGGLLLIAGPLPSGAKSLVTRLSPYFIHVAFHRWVLDNPNAGKPGYAPFPVYFARGCAPEDLARFLVPLGGCVLLYGRYASSHVAKLRKFPPAYFAYRIYARLAELLSGGRVDGRHTDFIAIFQKRPKM